MKISLKLLIFISLTFFWHLLYQAFFSLPSNQRFLSNPLQGSVSFSWYLPDFFGLLLALSCQHFEHFVFSILVLTTVLEQLISISVSSKKLLFFEGQSRKHFHLCCCTCPTLMHHFQHRAELGTW